MGRPKKQIELTILTLEELEKLIAEKESIEKGISVKPAFPKEKVPAWIPYCKNNYTAFHQQYQKRLHQLAWLGLSQTHAIDYYQNTKAINPI